MKIYLVGYMGSGKTTIGRPLAKQLEVEFVDMDHYISDKYNKSIAEIFTEVGEDNFRKIERESLHELSEKENVVISVGGGTPCFFDNMQFMCQTGLTIYLNVSSEGLASRLVHGMEKRPLLANKTPEQLLTFIKESLAKREQFYNKASVNVLCDGYSDVSIREKIVTVLSNLKRI